MISISEIENVSAPAPSAMTGWASRLPVPSPVIERIQSVLGTGVVLLPIPKGEKGPVTKGWQDTTLAEMLDPGYQTRLAGGNIGVLLGKSSGGIYAIDIDSDEAVEPFLVLNPRLQTTLRTHGSRGCQLWVRIPNGDVPKTTKLTTTGGSAWGEWRSDGSQSVIHGLHPKGMEYQWLVDAPAVEIAFDDIVWPEELKLPWPERAFREVVAELGEPVSKKAINHSVFARFFRMRNAVAIKGGKICVYDSSTGLWRIQSEADINAQLWKFTRQFLGGLDRADMKSSLRQAAIDEIRGMLVIEGERMREQGRGQMIHVKNGMLDLTQDPPTLLPFSPDYGSMRRTEINHTPEAQCPRFMRWVGGAMEQDDITLLQEWCGAVLLGPNLAQRLLMINGDAGSGKSSLVTLIEMIIGREVCQQLRVGQLGGRFETREYVSKILLTGKDVQADFLSGKNTTHLKSLTGGDLLSAERKMENEGVSFSGEFHVVVVSNDELTLRVEGDADAWERRLLSIRMKKPEELVIVPNIADVLFKEEAEGILAWAVEGAKRHLRHNYQYALTSGQQNQIKRIVDASDGVRLFVAQRLMVDEKSDSEVTMETLHTAYEKFATEFDYEHVKKNQLGRKLVPLIQKTLGLHQRHDLGGMFLKGGGHQRGYRGLLILN